jgi:hypothetical protein
MISDAGFQLGGAIAERNAGQLRLIMKVSPALNEVNLGFHLGRAR